MMEAGMGDVVNLKRFRKRTEREQSAKQADANRARFGRTKSERILDERRTTRANDVLEWNEGNFGTSRHDAVRTGGRDRQQPPARQPVFRDSSVRAGLFSHPRP